MTEKPRGILMKNQRRRLQLNHLKPILGGRLDCE